MAEGRNNFFKAAGSLFDGAAKAAPEAAGKMAGVTEKAAQDVKNVTGEVAKKIKPALKKGAGDVSNAVSSIAENALTSFGGSTGKVHVSSFRDDDGNYLVPDSEIDDREKDELLQLADQFEKLVKPNPVAMASQKVGGAIASGASKAIATVGKDDVYDASLKLISEAFDGVRDQANKISVGEEYVLNEINAGIEGGSVSSIAEICLLRSYDVARIAAEQRTQHLSLAFAEGAATGAPGLPGIPFNLVLSTFLFYRAVQSIAMFYGYDVKEDPVELEIAGSVLMEAMNVGQSTDLVSDSPEGAVSNQITKLMTLTEIAAVKQTVGKGWAEMAKRGGACLLVAQIRAMGNAGVRKTLAKTGSKGLEAGVFKGVFEKIGSKLTQKAVSRAVPVVGGAVGAVFDTAQMNTILKYADLFYHKRFIVEKEIRIAALSGEDPMDRLFDIDDEYEVPVETGGAEEISGEEKL